MRTAFARPLALVAVLALGACATSRGPETGVTPTSAVAPSAEEQRYVTRASELRDLILTRSSWQELGEGCNPGVLRAFMDTTAGGMATLDTLVRQLERIVVARGVGEPIDTPAGRDLLRVVALWEAAGPRPRWDATDGVDRRAVATGLTGQVMNPESGKCESYVDSDSVIIILPEGISLGRIAAKGAMTITAYTGDSSIAQARNAYFAHPGRDRGETFGYTRVGPVVLWREWGLVAVNRPLEILNGAQLDTVSAGGGATYLFRRVRNEWRLFLIVRTW